MKLLLFAVAGLMAQLVDGALGMAFGVTATTMLILSGTAPAQASAAVHFAEVGTTLFSGLAHWRLNNVHWPTVVFLGIPGAVGAFAGATVLSGLSTESAEPVVSTLLLLLGAYVLIRSVLVPWKKPEGGDPGDTGETVPVSSGSRRSRLGLVTLGLGGGFLDASGGGGWGVASRARSSAPCTPPCSSSRCRPPSASSSAWSRCTTPGSPSSAC